MRDLIAYADRQGKQVRLTPSGAYGGAPRRLTRFYARFGFVANAGPRRDPACRESMYRDPAARPYGGAIAARPEPSSTGWRWTG